MMTRTRSDFDSHDDWLAHILDELPVPEQGYALASGRMELFRSFYRMQGLPFPAEFAKDLDHIEMLHAPQRTAELESLNDVVLRTLTRQLFNRARPTISERDTQPPSCPREQIRQLLNYLAQENPYFALWVAYKRSVRGLGQIYRFRNSATRAPTRSRLRRRWRNWTESSTSSATKTGRFRAFPSSASGSFTTFVVLSEWPRRAPFWECSRRS